jgi:integrase
MALKLQNGVYHWRKVVKGQHFFKSTGTGDLKVAQMRATMWEAEIYESVVLRGERPMLLHVVLKAFLDARKGTGGHPNCKVHLSHFFKLPNIKFSDVTEEQVQGVIAARKEAGASHNTVVVSGSYWNAVVRFAQDKKWGQGPRLPRMYPEKTSFRWLRPEEETRLFAAIDPNASYPGKCKRTDKARQDNTDLLVGLLDTGARYREIARMTWNSVDIENQRVFIKRQKGGLDGTLVMSDRLHEMFARRFAERADEWVFPTKRKHNNNYKWLDSAAERAQLSGIDGKVTLHVARHTFATKMLGNGMSLLDVKNLLGHKNIQSTMVYLQVDANLVAVEAARKLNEMDAKRRAQAA